MKITTTIVCGIAAILSLSAFAGCTHSYALKAANELHFSVADISEVLLSYDEEAITFYQAEGDDLVIIEKMTKHKKSYNAKVTQDNRRIQISEGSKPFLKDGFKRSIDVYLPKSYKKNLTITTTNGNINLSGISLNLSSLCLSSTSGTLDLGHVEADHIKLETTSGNITCSELVGDVAYTSTSGNLFVKSAVGCGNYRTSNSGQLKVIYTDVTGDLTFFNKNDKIELTLPIDLEFKIEAASKNGSIHTSFDKNMSTHEETSYGIIGSNPTVTVKTETKNGDIHVTLY